MFSPSFKENQKFNFKKIKLWGLEKQMNTNMNWPKTKW